MMWVSQSNRTTRRAIQPARACHSSAARSPGRSGQNRGAPKASASSPRSPSVPNSSARGNRAGRCGSLIGGGRLLVVAAQQGDQAGGGVLAAQGPPGRAAVPQLVEGFVTNAVEG